MTPEVERPAPAKRPSLEDLIREQGVAKTATFENLLGAGADFWADDAEFERFTAFIASIRQIK